MSDGKTMVGTQITDERHQKWTDAIEDSDEFASIAQAIRVGVEQVLFEKESTGSGQTLEGEKILSRLDELEQSLVKTRGEVIETQEKTPTIEEISEEVVYRLAKAGQEEKRRQGGWEDGL
ncbi:hypothetical protein GRS48_04285 [Halorubrum sp. JWXQ-INN 858]|uniref:hypothetical protein n=1 Tax=Halorubrum sp. JWXQ-INN 858 TaxID=2690782 RepID=UPI001359750F|nr:hypothetical protein [Halorubrum sp. JWXQ-INN 858]MWV64044.1 hypothetical protein [Halorubrum sp. JWXQ-INN 858]